MPLPTASDLSASLDAAFESVEAEPVRAPVRVLIASDSGYRIEALEDQVSGDDSEPVECRRSTRADLSYNARQPGLDAILFDVADGRIADLDALHSLIEMKPGIPVIAMLRGTCSETALESLKLGADEVVDLLRNGDELWWRVRLAVQRAAARTEMEPATPAVQTERQAPAVTLVQETGDAMIILDRDGHVAFASPAAEALLGKPLDQLAGQPFPLEMHNGDVTEIDIVQPDGQRRQAEMRMVETEWGGMPAQIATLTDVTVRRRLEDAVNEAAAARRDSDNKTAQFFSSVTHDLRTPLTHIIGFSELMKNEQFGPLENERYREYVNDIHVSSQMLLEMIDDMIAVVDACPVGVLGTGQDTTASELLRRIVQQQGERAERRGMTLTCAAEADLPAIGADAARLGTAISRLLTEMIHAMPPASDIRLVGKRVDGCLSFTISGAAPIDAHQPSLPLDDPYVSNENSGGARASTIAAAIADRLMEQVGGRLEFGRTRNGTAEITLTLPTEPRLGKD